MTLNFSKYHVFLPRAEWSLGEFSSSPFIWQNIQVISELFGKQIKVSYVYHHLLVSTVTYPPMAVCIMSVFLEHCLSILSAPGSFKSILMTKSHANQNFCAWDRTWIFLKFLRQFNYANKVEIYYLRNLYSVWVPWARIVSMIQKYLPYKSWAITQTFWVRIFTLTVFLSN
jgi:hypothetical protein